MSILEDKVWKKFVRKYNITAEELQDKKHCDILRGTYGYSLIKLEVTVNNTFKSITNTLQRLCMWKSL